MKVANYTEIEDTNSNTIDPALSFYGLEELENGSGTG